MSTVTKGKGFCVHCGQGIDAEEIKRQARGESPFGKWKDRLYAVAAVRYQPKLDKNGRIQRYKTGDKAGQIKTEKVRYFRPPNERDLEALTEAEKMLEANWTRWEDAGLIPTERIPEGNDMRPVIYGMSRWCDMFTPRQLLGHLFLVEELNRLKPRILEEIGPEKGKAVITYLQFAIDKGLDYNSRQTRWHYSRGVLLGTFARHDFSLKWTFGEMVFTGPNSGAAWGLSQILDAYKGIADLLEPVQKATNGDPPLTLLNGTAAAMPQVPGQSVDVICFDPPYYNNVQYGELSDYFYVWQKRTLGDLYPDLFHRRLTNKEDEVVANPARDKGEANAKAAYERMMGEIFEEARRILKDDGIMTMMFTHKSQEAWETLTQALIEKGWVITSSVPVESETEQGIHTKETASAISSIFISCRKRTQDDGTPSSWKGFGGTGVQQKVQAGVEQGLEEFSHLRLNPVDRMVACYGRALQVLSENWPVLDGDEQVGPKRAMLEASRVVAEAQFRETARGHLSLSDLAPEAAMAMLLFGVFGLAPFDYDDGLNLSKSLNIALETKTGGYLSNGRFIGINTEESSRRSSGLRAEEKGFSAPLARRGSKLRLVLPEERDERRLENPQTEWDLLQGTIMAYREGMEVAARGYLDRKARDKTPVVTNLLRIWAEEIADDTLKKEAQGLLFGLGARQEV
jgi:adenine-specific DNA methylase